MVDVVNNARWAGANLRRFILVGDTSSDVWLALPENDYLFIGGKLSRDLRPSTSLRFLSSGAS